MIICRDVASVELTDRSRLTAARVVPRVLMWPTDHHETLREPLFKLFKSGPRGLLEASDGPSPMHRTYACKDHLHGQDLRCGLQDKYV